MNLLFFSTDEYFLNQVTTFISRTQQEINIVTYSNFDKAQNYLNDNFNKIGVVLAEEYFFENWQYSNIIPIIISSRTNLTAEGDFYSLNVYQQGEDLIRDLKKICLDKNTLGIIADANKLTKLVSFFSIQGCSGQSTIAYQLATSSAQKCKVLYLSFDFVNIYQQLYPAEYSVDLADMMFQIKDKMNEKSNFYQAVVRNQHGVYVLPPFQTIGDITELTEEDVTYLLQQMINLNEFDYIFVDLNHELSHLNQVLMQMSQKIISVYTADLIGQQKQNYFLKDPYIAKLGLLNHIELVNSKVQKEEFQKSSNVEFPYIQEGNDLFHSYYDNSNFRQSCLALQERIISCN